MFKSRRMIWAGHVARKTRTSYNILFGKPERRPLLRPEYKWEGRA
jgi:hypothetical protein